MFNKILLSVLLGLSICSVALYALGAISEDVLLYWCYFLLAITLLLAVIFPVAGLIKEPKKLLRLGGLLLLSGVVIAVCYALSSTEIHGLNKEVAAQTSAITVRWTDVGFYFLYVLIGLTIAAVIYSEIKNVLK